MNHFLISHGYLALIVLGVIQAFIVPIPSEATFGFAGVLASEHHMNLIAIVLIGSLAETVGASLAYICGRLGGRPLVLRYGRYVLISSADLARAERWLDGRGEYAVAVGRATPLIRMFVSWIVGISDMMFAKFVVFSFIGTAVYATLLSEIGYHVGPTWDHVIHDFKVAGYVVGVIVVLGFLAVVRHRYVELKRSEARAVRASVPREDPAREM